MNDLIRDAPLGQIIRYVTKGKFFKYPEEMEGFQLPPEYLEVMNSSGPVKPRRKSSDSASEKRSRSDSEDVEKLAEKDVDPEPALSKRKTQPDREAYEENPMGAIPTLTRSKSRHETIPHSSERHDVESEHAISRTKSTNIAPQKTNDGIILVDWYATDDNQNPQNWTQLKKAWVAFVICMYTFVVYCGSSIYTTGEESISKEFGLSPLDASLPLSLYVLAYGMGPLIFSPLSEIPALGRSPVYAATFFVFLCISIGPPLVHSFASLLVLRYLQGFFGSPCLATGGATMQDMYSLLYLPYSLSAWVSAAYCGPALGPLLSGFAVMHFDWRWSLWEILWMAGPVMILMMLLLPETSTPNLLLRRAQRLRKLTGDNRLMSQSEIDQKSMQVSEVLFDAIVKPMEITLKDPAIAFVNTYAAIIYGIYYSFFEVFPLVYNGIYGFNIGEIGIVFLCVLVACGLGVLGYFAYLSYYLIPDIMKNGLRAQEHRLVPAIFCTFGAPIGLFLFAWTSRESIHWIAPTIGIVIYAGTAFVVFQCMFVYVPMSYPQYAASLFAANDFFRSAFACGSILYARPLFINLGIGKGVSVLGGLSFLGVIGMFILYYFGANMRRRSKFAVSE